MMTKKMIGVAAAVASVLGAGSAAWACTAQLGTTVKPGVVAPGAMVTVEGDGSPGPVEIRWDGVDGEVLARVADGKAYAVTATVPQAEPGVHTVVAVSRDAEGKVTSRGQFALEIRAAGSTGTRSPELYRGLSSDNGLDTQRAVGVGLLGLGGAALFGGFAVAEARRRKALAS